MASVAASLNSWVATRVNSLDYPPLGLQARISGKVYLSVEVDVSGAVKKVIVISGEKILADAARKNLETWKFTSPPGQGAYSSQNERFEFIYVFRLLDENSPRSKEEFSYEFPNKVTLSARAPHLEP